MEILIFSKILKHLNINLAKTSSEIFEIEFAEALSQFAKVSIVSQKAERNQQYENIKLYSLNNYKNIVEEIRLIIEANSIFKDSIKIIVAFGYDIKTFYSLRKVSKRYNSKLISYTFDTHKGSIYGKKYIRKLLINTYFNIGIKYLNKIDGIILFNEQAYKEMRLNIPFMVSKVGVREEIISQDVFNRKSQDKFRVVYSGTLIEYNSIRVLIDTMSYLEGENVSLEIYGDGPLKEFVEKSVDKSNNIIYHGLVSNNQVNNAIKSADLLINLRDTKDYVSKFAFPSKLIQYMASGIPVLTTKVLTDAEFSNAVFITDNLDSKKIRDIIVYVKNHPTIQAHKAEYAKEYIKENFLWSKIIKEVICFFGHIHDEDENGGLN